MCTSVTSNKRHYIKATAFCAAVTAFLIVFGVVYDHFGRGMHSSYINYAFTFPFALCVLPYSVLATFKDPHFSRFSFNIYNSGVAVLTSFSIFRGVIRIAGLKIASPYELPMLICGIAFCAAGLIVYAVTFFIRKKK